MSASIPVFKIRCVFSIILLFIFFMLFGLTRRAFAVDCSLNDYSVSYYKTSSARQAAYDASSFPYFGSYTSNIGFVSYECYGAPAGLSVIYKWKSTFSDGKWYYQGDIFVLDTSCDDGPDADGYCRPLA